ncbi:MAG: helix-turn-helix transcriptional regulator [Deferrisomatales bacterium]
MGDHLGLERYYWFDREVRRGAYPNAARLAERFELSSRTALRALDFMRFRLGAPLEYVACRRGFRYTDPAYALPPLLVSEDELLAVLVAQSILAQTARGPVADGIRSLAAKLGTVLGGAGPGCLTDLLSAAWPGAAPADPAVFGAVLPALAGGRLLDLAYRSPLAAEPTARRVEPHHLRHHGGDWVLTAYCRLRGEWRPFHLSRMAAARDTGEPFRRRPADHWRPRLDGGFGLFQGERLTTVRLRFTPFRARYVAGQLWHADQVACPLADGGLELTVPAADLREIRLKVLSFGADVEVLAPPELRAWVAAEAARTAARYAQEKPDP